jgi:hypothetical protein
MRNPSDWEKALFAVLAASDIADGDTLAQQLKDARIEDQDDGYLRIETRCDKDLSTSDSFPLYAWYRDSDGMIVLVLLHAGRPNGCISLLERYRVDGSPITSWEPTISGVTLGMPDNPKSLS